MLTSKTPMPGMGHNFLLLSRKGPIVLPQQISLTFAKTLGHHLDPNDNLFLQKTPHIYIITHARIQWLINLSFTPTE